MRPGASSSTVSVIITTYNRAAVLRATIESVLAQSHPAVEILVVDDGSTDDTAATVSNYGSRVRYVRQENQGVEVARRKGLRASTGRYVNFLDDDDLMVPHKIARQAEILDSSNRFGVVHCGYRYIDKNGHVLGQSGRLPEGDMLKPLVWGCPPWSGGPLIRRECFDGYGEDEHLDWYSDWGMWLRITRAGYRWACVQETLGDYRIVSGSMIDNRIPNAERLIFHLLREVFEGWHLPPEIVAEKNDIHAGWHFWISCRYYTVGSWGDARRSLIKALEHRPVLLAQPEKLVNLLYWDAVSPRARVHDPIGFIRDVFDHLPSEARAIEEFRGLLLGRVYRTLALCNYGSGNMEEGRRQLGEAVRQAPGLFTNPADFAGQLASFVQSMPGQVSEGFVDSILQGLPPKAVSLRLSRLKLLAAVNAALAFKAYATGCRSLVPRHILKAVLRDPRWVGNRGAMAVLVKSLPALVSR
ncbi:MAG: glycosyltransferase [Syntrophobacteraceae bacterium]|jgi:glycosyltransferase involved in cell wall biosynthesis|nr:glycosyltransferase [Syntrophobacteraceae bacterium]